MSHLLLWQPFFPFHAFIFLSQIHICDHSSCVLREITWNKIAAKPLSVAAKKELKGACLNVTFSLPSLICQRCCVMKTKFLGTTVAYHGSWQGFIFSVHPFSSNLMQSDNYAFLLHVFFTYVWRLLNSFIGVTIK